MARGSYYAQFAVTVPKNTPITAPITTALPLQDAWVFDIRYIVPAGSSGLMGWYIAFEGKVIVPWANTPTYIVVDNDKDDFIVQTEVNGGLQFVGYNTDKYPHVVYLRVRYLPIAQYLAEISPSPVPLEHNAALNGIVTTPTPTIVGVPSGEPGFPSFTPFPSVGPGPLPSTFPGYTPSPTVSPYPSDSPSYPGGHMTIIVPDHTSKTIWLVTTEPRQKVAITSPADESAYRAAGVKLVNLSEAELASYPTGK